MILFSQIKKLWKPRRSDTARLPELGSETALASTWLSRWRRLPLECSHHAVREPKHTEKPHAAAPAPSQQQQQPPDSDVSGLQMIPAPGL